MLKSQCSNGCLCYHCYQCLLVAAVGEQTQSVSLCGHFCLVNIVSIGPILELLYRWLKLNFIIFTKNCSLLKLLAYNIQYSCHNIWDIVLRLLEPDFMSNLDAILKGKISLWFYYAVCDCVSFSFLNHWLIFVKTYVDGGNCPLPPQYRGAVWQMYELVW